MTVTEALGTLRYVVDANGEKKEALIPLPAWEILLNFWKGSREAVDDDESPHEILTELAARIDSLAAKLDPAIRTLEEKLAQLDEQRRRMDHIKKEVGVA